MALCSKRCLFGSAILLTVPFILFPMLIHVPDGIHEKDRSFIRFSLFFLGCLNVVGRSVEFLGYGDSLMFFKNIETAMANSMIPKPDIPNNVTVYNTSLDGIPVHVLHRVQRDDSASASVAKPAIIFYHGGGWVLGRPETSDFVFLKYLEEMDIVIVAVRYRLAPEHPFPTPLNDCEKVTSYLLRKPEVLGIDVKRIAIAGESAGGNLAAAVALKLRQEAHLPPVKLQLLIYPALQAFDLGTPAYTDPDNHLLLSDTMMAKFWLYYMHGNLQHVESVRANRHTSAASRRSEYGRYTSHTNLPTALIHRDHRARGVQVGEDAVWQAVGRSVSNPFICPLMADSLEGLPKALIITVGFDVLRDDGFFYAKRLKESGNDITHMHYKDTLHGAYSIQGLFVGEQMNNYVMTYLKHNL